MTGGWHTQAKPGCSISDLSYLCLPEAQRHQLHLTFLFQRWERAEVKVSKLEFNGSRTFKISHYSKKKGGLSYSLTPAPPDEILPK